MNGKTGCGCLLLFFVVLSFLPGGICPAVAMDGDELARQQKMIKLGTGINIVTGEGREEVLPDRVYDYVQGTVLVSEGRQPGRWYYYMGNDAHQQPPEEEWVFLAEAGSMDLDGLVAQRNGGGFLHVRFVGEATRRAVFRVPTVIMEARINTGILLAQNKTYPLVIETVSEGEVGLEDVVYQFKEGGFFMRRSPQEAFDYYANPIEIRGGGAIQVYWAERGLKSVNVKSRGKDVEGFGVEVYEFAQETTVVAVNANDSNGDGIRDLDQKQLKDPVTGAVFDDPDIVPVRFYLIGEYPEVKYALGVDGVGREIFRQFCEARLWMEVSHEWGVDFYNDRSKEEQVFLHEAYLVPELFDKEVAFLNNLFAEGTSFAPGDLHIRFVTPSYVPDGAVFEAVADLKPLHISMPYKYFLNDEAESRDLRYPARGMEHIFGVYLAGDTPVNRLENPAVIHIPTPEDGVLSNFSVHVVEAVDVPADWIWWRVRPYENPVIPYRPGEELPVEPGEAICRPENGRRISIEGIREGYVTVEVGVKGNDVPYLTKNCYVGRKIRFPFCFKILNPEQYDLPHLKSGLADALKISNVILRQVGVELVAVPENAAERSLAGRKAEIEEWNLEKTLKIRNGEFCFRKSRWPIHIPLRFENCAVKVFSDEKLYCDWFAAPNELKTNYPFQLHGENPENTGPRYVAPELGEMRRRYDLEVGEDAVHGFRCYDVEEWMLNSDDVDYSFVPGVVPGAINFHLLPEESRGVRTQHQAVPAHRIVADSSAAEMDFIMEEGTGRIGVSGKTEGQEFFSGFEDVLCATVSPGKSIGIKSWFGSYNPAHEGFWIARSILGGCGVSAGLPSKPRALIPAVESKSWIPVRNLELIYSRREGLGLGINLGQAMMVRSTKFHEPRAPLPPQEP